MLLNVAADESRSIWWLSWFPLERQRALVQWCDYIKQCDITHSLVVLGLGGLLALRKEHELFVVFFTFGHSVIVA